MLFLIKRACCHYNINGFKKSSPVDKVDYYERVRTHITRTRDVY